MSDKTIEVGNRYTAPCATEWEVVRILKRHVQARKLSHPDYGTRQKFTPEQVGEWRRHELPSTLKIGDVLMHHGEPVTVSSFPRLGVDIVVGLTGRWGFEKGHSHENLFLNRSRSGLFADGLRLPFDGELLAARAKEIS